MATTSWQEHKQQSTIIDINLPQGVKQNYQVDCVEE
jgi:hypothetical protein